MVNPVVISMITKTVVTVTSSCITYVIFNPEKAWGLFARHYVSYYKFKHDAALARGTKLPLV